MNCPACGTVMTEIAAGDVKVQACKGGCGQSGSARPIGWGVSPQHSAERVTESGPEPAAQVPARLSRHDAPFLERETRRGRGRVPEM